MLDDLQHRIPGSWFGERTHELDVVFPLFDRTKRRAYPGFRIWDFLSTPSRDVPGISGAIFVCRLSMIWISRSGWKMVFAYNACRWINSFLKFYYPAAFWRAALTTADSANRDHRLCRLVYCISPGIKKVQSMSHKIHRQRPYPPRMDRQYFILLPGQSSFAR